MPTTLTTAITQYLRANSRARTVGAGLRWNLPDCKSQTLQWPLALLLSLFSRDLLFAVEFHVWIDGQRIARNNDSATVVRMPKKPCEP